MSGSKFRAFLRMDSKLTDRCMNEASSESLEIFSKRHRENTKGLVIASA